MWEFRGKCRTTGIESKSFECVVHDSAASPKFNIKIIYAKSVGYTDFINMVALSRWWLPKTVFRFFLSGFLRICIQSLEKNAKRSKKMFSSIWILKNAEFHADFKSVEKVKKIYQKKLLAKTWQKYALFPLKLMFVKLVLLVTFLVAVF